MIFRNTSGSPLTLQTANIIALADGATIDLGAIVNGQQLYTDARIEADQYIEAAVGAGDLVVVEGGSDLNTAASLAAVRSASTRNRDQTVAVVTVSQALTMPKVFVGAGDLTGEGVYVLDSDLGTAAPVLELEAGLALHGLEVRIGGNDATSSAGGRLVTLRCESDAGAMLVGESLAVSVPDQRFTVVGSSAANVGVDSRPIQFMYDSDAVRWYVPDWSSLTGGDDAHWVGGVPGSSQEAIHRIAAAVFAVHGQIP